MAPRMSLGTHALLVLGLLLVLLPTQTWAFGAGNIASISAVEGKNWRHGDIEDMLKTIAFIKGHKWTSMMVKRVYFGNWLRDYSQAMDVGTLKSLPAETIRILVWILSFMTFGYATAEFEVTSERLGVYRPEEHIDNPKDYADNQDAREFDQRLRGPVRQVELDIDPETGMKNYIANEEGGWATSSAYIKYSLARSIHYGRTYTHGSKKGNEEDLCEALRCLGQGLHTLEDFAAHTNYIELALREMGFRNVFPHTGVNTQMNVRGHHVFPLVTGTFGMVDFFHSVLGEANDHFTQSEVNEMDIALGDAEANSSGGSLGAFTGLLGNIPGTKDLVEEAEELKRRSEAQESANRSYGARSGYTTRGVSREVDDYSAPRSRGFDDEVPTYRANENERPGEDSQSGSALQDFDPSKTIAQIYPILEFRDKVVRKLASIIEKIPGLEAIVEKITETLTVFVMSLLAPFIRPLINAASKSLQAGSSGVIDASGKHQYEPWTDPNCTDPTHSLLSKDHFSNILNEPAGQVASAILKYVAPRVLYAWQNLDVSDDQVLEDCLKVFHHPALRNMNNEAHRTMFKAVQAWVDSRPDRGADLNDVLSAEGLSSLPIPGISNLNKLNSAFSNLMVGGGTRGETEEAENPARYESREESQYTTHHQSSHQEYSSYQHQYQSQSQYYHSQEQSYQPPPPPPSDFGNYGGYDEYNGS
ncbi:IBR domain family protein [Aspergillus niger]|uniref:IBR domain family protein n=1 Tax=Aspergillus niger TaxID=5061 RepID=A0A505HU24_ASPNG|nr:IBR domain family protein [Aspergillus niger]